MSGANSAQFTIAYDGEALKDHRIDVRDLAPALLGIGQTVEHANACINGDRADVRVTVRANPRAGSFIIDFDLLQSLAKQVTEFFTSNPVTAAANLSELLGFTAGTAGSVIWLIKKLRGKKAKKTDLGGGKVRLEIEGETAIEVLSEVACLYENVGVRSGLVRALEPLKRPGIDKLEVKQDGAIPILEIRKDETWYFETPAQETISEVLPERVWTSAFTIVSLAFKEDNKWRLSDGALTISASILDEEFLARVDQRMIAFAKGDVLICEVRLRQTHTPEGLKSEYDVLRVVEHKRAPKQFKLFDRAD